MTEAVIGLLGLVLGVLLSKLTEVLVEDRKRNSRETDLVIAIHAEISASIASAS